MKKILWLILCSMMGLGAHAQHSIISRSSIENRTRIVGEMPRDPEKEAAERFAKQFGIPIRETDTHGRVKEIRRIVNQTPLYYSTHNLNAAKTTSTNKLWDGNIGGLNLLGDGILVGVWDGGMVRTTHVEFGSRAYFMDNKYDIIGHATHVAGTIGAAGLDSAAKGMASHCFLESYDWDNDNLEMDQAAKDGLLISNHSYGFIHGFDYNSTENRWEWYGNPDIDEYEDYNFGFYGLDARIWDEIAADNPSYLIVKSAGNDRLENPGSDTVHYIWDNGWKESSVERNKDGGPDGFDCVGSQATSKNILTVGAVRDIPGGYERPEDVEMTSFSAFGPCDDGRIKPDIVGNGTNLHSTYSGNNKDYSSQSGTSMAAPNVSGSLVLLQELYFHKYLKFMWSSTLKGLVLHTADDPGNEGPDYKFGWGLLNTYSAARLIDSDDKLLIQDSIYNKSARSYRFYATGDSVIKVTMCWTDPAGPELEPSLDPQNLILVNDLDIRLTGRSDSTVYEPFVLIPETPDIPAIRGDNFRDNVEQILVPVSEKGYYDLVVSHKKSLTDSPQHFSLIVEGVKEVIVAPDSSYLDENNGFIQLTNAPEYPLNQQFKWLINPVSQEPITLNFTEFNTAPNDSVTIYNGPDSSFPVLGRFSGTLSNPDTLLFSDGESLFIEFSSGDQRGFKGFSARYCTSPPEEIITILGKENPCYNYEETYLFEGDPASDYQWTLSDNIKDSASFSQNTVTVLVPEEPFRLLSTPINRCGRGESSDLTIHPLVSPPIIMQKISGDTLPCPNDLTLYTVENDSSTTYRWVLPLGWRGRSDSSSIWLTPEMGQGILTVFPGNSCGESDAIDLTIYPVSLPDAPVIRTINSEPCENSVQEFYFKPEEDVDYRWDVEEGWELLSPDTLDHVLVRTGSGVAGRVFLTSTNKCGETPSSKNYILTPGPVPPVLRSQPSFIEGIEEIVLQNFSFFNQVNWYRNDSIIPDFHEEYLIIQRNGTYSVEVSNSDGCWTTTAPLKKILVEEESLVYNISTASGGIIKVENDSNEPAAIRVYDLAGRIVFSNEVQAGSNIYHTTRRGLLIFRIEGVDLVKSQLVFIH